MVGLLVVGFVIGCCGDHHPQFVKLGDLVGGVDRDGVRLSLPDSIAKARLRSRYHAPEREHVQRGEFRSAVNEIAPADQLLGAARLPRVFDVDGERRD